LLTAPHHIPVKLNHQQHCSDKLRSHTMCTFCGTRIYHIIARHWIFTLGYIYYYYYYYYIKLPIYKILLTSNKQMCGERQRERVVINRWYSDRPIWQWTWVSRLSRIVYQIDIDASVFERRWACGQGCNVGTCEPT
jgi:hypothetical protein